MASYMNRTVICQCCGGQYEAKILRGLYLSSPTGLDTKPYHPAVYDKVVICPHCGYATERLGREVSEKERQFMETDRFRMFRYDFSMDETLKKLHLAAVLAEEGGRWKDAGLGFLKAYWYIQENDLSEDWLCIMRREAIGNLDKHLQQTLDPACALIYIDLCRQDGDFEKAIEAIRFLESQGLLETYFEKDLIGIVELEKQLVEAKDRGEHKTDEVV